MGGVRAWSECGEGEGKDMIFVKGRSKTQLLAVQ